MRVPRLTKPGVVYHLTSRFVDREWFFHDDTEREKYLALFGEAIGDSDWSSLSYALMSNHIHHAFLAGAGSLGSIFKKTHSPFANWMNVRHGRLGPIFADRPSCWEVRSENEPRVIAYIHNNPVRAGVVARARDSSWTSHRAFIGVTAAPPWLDIELARERCGLVASYFDDWAVDVNDVGETNDLSGIRRAVRKRGAVEVGTPIASPVEVPLVVRPFARVLPTPLDVLAVVGDILRIDPLTFRSRSRAPALVAARRAAVHGGVAIGVTASDMATSLGITRQAGALISAMMKTEVDAAVVVLVKAHFTNLTPSPSNVAKR